MTDIRKHLPLHKVLCAPCTVSDFAQHLGLRKMWFIDVSCVTSFLFHVLSVPILGLGGASAVCIAKVEYESPSHDRNTSPSLNRNTKENI